MNITNEKIMLSSLIKNLPIIMIPMIIINLIRKINSITETKLYDPESLDHLDKADDYIKKYRSNFK